MLDVSVLYTWAYIRGENRNIRSLAVLSFPREDWSGTKKPCKNVDSDYFILWKYVHHTFDYLWNNEKHKIYEEENVGCFNLGLETDKYEDIYAFFEKSVDDDKFFLVGFFEESNNKLNRIRSKLPSPASYILDPSDFIYDPKYEEDYSLNHILERQERLPRVIKNIPEQYREDVIINRMRRAFKRLKRNYKLAVPQYSPRLKEIQLLVPLCIENNLKADCALAVRKIDNVYVAKTVLTMDMAYNNARLITRPDPEWLRPLKDKQDIEDDEIVRELDD